jgi:hypothetical protein
MAEPYAVVTAVVIEALSSVVHCCFGLPPAVVTALLIAVLQAESHDTYGLAVHHALIFVEPAVSYTPGQAVSDVGHADLY